MTIEQEVIRGSFSILIENELKGQQHLVRETLNGIFVRSKSEFADKFLELSLFFKAFQALYSELLCIFPCFCPYGQFTRESFF